MWDGSAKKGSSGQRARSSMASCQARGVAVRLAVGRGETAMDDTELPDAGAVQPLQRSDPQFQVRIDRILDQHGDVGVLERIGNLLHQERVRRRTGADPQHVHAVLETLIDMLLVRHFGADRHAVSSSLSSATSDLSIPTPFEAARMRAGFPDARPEHVNAPGGKAPSRLQYLLFAFCAARARDYHRPREREESPLIDGDDIECLFHYFVISSVVEKSI
jgi:hypothetical protein